MVLRLMNFRPSGIAFDGLHVIKVTPGVPASYQVNTVPRKAIKLEELVSRG